MFEPTNEAETIELYKLVQEQLGWRIVHLQTPFPDAIIENASGQQLVAEFEYTAKNFKAHGHDPAGCDLVICWTNGWADAPVPVWALEDCVPADCPVWGEFALKMLYDNMHRDRPEFRYQRLTEGLQQHLTEIMRPHLTEEQRRRLRKKLSDTIRPVLEHAWRLKGDLFDLMCEASERAGGVVIILCKDGEKPQIVSLALHERRKEAPCAHCGETFEYSVAGKHCSVECHLATLLEKFDAALADL